MDEKRIDCGIVVELTDCMKNSLMGKGLHRTEELSRQGKTTGRTREEKQPREKN